MNLAIQLPNGLTVSGRTEEWLVAILKTLTPEQQRAVFQAVQQKLVAYETPGNYVLHAEPFSLGFTPGNGQKR